MVNDPTPADVDGDGDDEQAFTYFLPSADIWHLRVVDGATEHDHTVVGSSMVWESTVLGARDIDDDGPEELFVTIEGGAYTQSFGVFQLVDCDIIQTPDQDGDPMSWYYGSSVQNVLRVECDPVMPFMHDWVATISAWTDDSEPETWSVDHTKLGLMDHVWEPVPASAGGDYDADGPAPPISGGLDCDFG